MSEGKQWNRRSFDVTPNGYFTVLKPSGWFPTVRLPGGFRYLIGENGKPKPLLHTDNPKSVATADATVCFQMVGSTDGKRNLLRFGLIVLAAIALTFGLLFCCGGLDALLNQL